MYIDLIILNNEVLNDIRWAMALLPLCFLSFLAGVKTYANSPVRRLGIVAYICAIMWATIIPIMAALPMMIVTIVIYDVGFDVPLVSLPIPVIVFVMLLPPIAAILFFLIIQRAWDVPVYVAKKIKPTNSPDE